MESVSVTNQNMKNIGLDIGIVIPPDKFHKPILYSDRIASHNYKVLDKDIYQSVQKSKNLNDKKTPKSVFWMLGIGALAIAFPFLRKLFK